MLVDRRRLREMISQWQRITMPGATVLQQLRNPLGRIALDVLRRAVGVRIPPEPLDRFIRRLGRRAQARMPLRRRRITC